MNVNLIWVPAGGSNSTSQTVQYRIPSQTSTWTTHSSVGASVSTASITGLNDNFIYEFRIINICPVGGQTSSTVEQKIKFVCPSVTTSLTYNSVGFTFTPVGGDVSSYKVDLLNSSDSIVATKTFNAPSGAVSDSFTGLAAQTNYKIRIAMTAGAFSKTCDSISVTTPDAPQCLPPTNVTVTVS